MKVEIDYEESERISKLLHSIGEGEPRKFYITLGFQPRRELHLTDDPRIICPMVPYCRIVLSLKPKINRRTAAIFIRGQVYDQLFKMAFNFVEDTRKLGDCPTIGHPDVIEGKIPIEAKHTTKPIRTVEDIPKKWLFQTKLEATYCHSLVGKLAIGEILTTLITVWKCTLTQRDLDVTIATHRNRMKELNSIIEDKTPNKFLNEEEGLILVRSECKKCFYNYKDGCPYRPGGKK